MTVSWGTAIGIVIIAVLWWLWERQHGEDDPEFAEREGMYGWRLLKSLAAVLLMLVAGLTLLALDVPGGAAIAAVAFLAFVLVVFLGPLFGPKRGPRDRAS